MPNNLSFLRVEHSLENISWHFFATNHGKGAIDGVGGIIKRFVCSRVISRKCIVTDATSFANCVVGANIEINVVLVSPEAISAYKQKLDVQWSDIKPLPKTNSVHCIQSGKEHLTAFFKPYSAYNEGKLFNFITGEVTTSAAIGTMETDPFVISQTIIQGDYVIANHASYRGNRENLSRWFGALVEMSSI